MEFLHISTGNNYPPDKRLADGLRQNGHSVFELIKEEKSGAYSDFIRRFRETKHSYEYIIVGYSLPLLVPIIRFFSRKKILFNAISSQYEANIISRGIARPWSLSACKWWLIDFFSFHLSSFVLLESSAQMDFVEKFFFVPQKKMIRTWMGIDEEIFFFDPSIKKSPEFTALFRGRFLPESGILTVIKAAKILEDRDIRFTIVGHGFMYREVTALMKELSPKNIFSISEKIGSKELREYMLSSHVCLGQLADHPRLSRTLPCKLFESLALKIPYLTGRNAGVLELLRENDTCLAVSPSNEKELADKILFLKEHPEILKKIGENGYLLHQEKLTSKILGKEILSELRRK